MSQLLCYSCFQPLEEQSPFCPNCGQPTMTDPNKYPLALPCGTILSGRYILGRVLGQGGFGITYVAQDHKTGQLVAVKEFFPETMATRGANGVTPYTGQLTDNFTYGRQCFLEEAETLARFLGNPGIVRVHSYFEENGTAYFAMDYIKGIDLESYIKKQGGKLSWEETTRLLFPIMDALSAVHAQGIIHRDVTPDNICLTDSGEIKLLDFGAARYSLGDRSRSLDVVLKHGFAPKEQYSRRGRQGPYTDVYAMAATVYYCLTGRILPDSIDRMEDGDLVLPSSLGAALPSIAEDALDKALSVQPQDRFQTMAAFKNALQQRQPAPQAVAAAPSPSAPPVYQQPGPSYPPQSAGPSYHPQPGPSFTPQPAGPSYHPQPGPSFTPQAAPPAAPPQKKSKKWLIPVISCSAGLLVTILLVVLLTGRSDKKESEPTPSLSGTGTVQSDSNDRPSADSGGDSTDSTDNGEVHSGGSLTAVSQNNNRHYRNDTVLFELDYPADCLLDDSVDRCVSITDESGADLYFYAEYFNALTNGETIETASYCADLISRDLSILEDWIGTDGYVVTDSGRTTIGGKDCYTYDWDYNDGSIHFSGQFLLMDTDGNFGCYAILWMINQDSGKIDTCYEYANTMKNSFRISGPYEAEIPEPVEPPQPPSPVLQVDPNGMDNYMASSAPGAVWAYSIMDMDDREMVGSGAMYDQLSSSALLDIPILYACAALSDEGIISLQTTIRIDRATPGRGVLHGKVGQSLSVYDLLRYMLQYSDNTASNTIMGNLTFQSINQTCARYGYTSVNLNNYILSTTDYTANDNYVSCADLCGMLQELYSGRFSTIGPSFLRENMRIQDSTARDGLGKSAPASCTFLNLNGQKADKYNEVAIIDDGSKAYAVAFMGSRASMEKLTAAAQTCGRYVYGAVGLR